MIAQEERSSRSQQKKYLHWKYGQLEYAKAFSIRRLRRLSFSEIEANGECEKSKCAKVHC